MSRRDPGWWQLFRTAVYLCGAWAVVLTWLWLLERRDDWRRWQWRRRFARLDPHEQEAFRFMLCGQARMLYTVSMFLKKQLIGQTAISNSIRVTEVCTKALQRTLWHF